MIRLSLIFLHSLAFEMKYFVRYIHWMLIKCTRTVLHFQYSQWFALVVWRN